MNTLSLLSFTAFLTSFILCIYILRLSLKSPLTVTYALLTLCSSIWSFCYTFIYAETDISRIWGWYKASSFGWVLMQALGIHFCLLMTRKEKLVRSWWVHTLLYLPAAALIARIFTGPLLVKDFKIGTWGPIEIVADFGTWLIFFIAFCGCSFVIRILLLTVYAQKGENKNLRNQALIFIITDIVSFIAIITLNVIVPAFLQIDIPALGSIIMVITPLSVWYGIKQYKLFYYNLYISSPGIELNRRVLNTLFDMESIFDAIKAAVVVVDENLYIIKMNTIAINMAGKNPNESEKCYEYLYGYQNPCTDCPLITRESKIGGSTLFLKEKNTWIEKNMFLLKGDDAGVSGIVEIAVDKTEKMRNSMLKDDIERIMQHDLKNSLTGIIGASQMLNESGISSDQHLYTDLIYSNAKDMNNLITNAIEFYKIEDGTYRLVPENIELIKLFKIISDNLIKHTSQRSIRIRILINDKEIEKTDTYYISGSYLHIKTMFFNLIKNAVEASPFGKTVTISLQGGLQHTIDIHNFGSIPEEIRSVFFQKYVTFNKDGGTGLGAYSSLLIARVHGGDIRFSSNEPEGTHLIVTLPHTI